MKDKEKQIEEMAKVIYDTDCAVESCEYVSESIKKGVPLSRINTQFFINTKQAERLYNAGYRKPLEDSVVISREEYDKLKYTWITDSDAYKKGSNETAEKILKAVLEEVGEFYAGDIVEELAKQYGVEIKE